MKIAVSGFQLALLSMLFMGISNYLYKRSTDAIGATNTTFYYYAFSAILATGMWLFFREDSSPALADLTWPLAIAVSLFLSVWCFNLALGSLDVSVASTVRGSFFVVTFVLAVLLSGEPLTARRVAAAALALLAVWLYGTDSSV